MKQKALTHLLDEASWQVQLASSSTTRQALLRSEAEPGARAFLTATPGGSTRMETAIFVTKLRHRLGIPDSVQDCWCPQCHGILGCMPAPAWLVARKPCATPPSVMSSASGLIGPASSLKKNAKAFFCHNDLRR
jgi:hypothetical protein